ncbi:MAG: pyridoxamine 5'-phosphate oxidase family protein [Rhodothermales bacterium]|nr:pyridoxamine 5'-phosphate oxidase family protein [Rhodothermales bacterium]
MPRDYAAQPRTAMRRSDRAVEDDAWIRAFLARAAAGALATVHDGQPFINTNLFVYDAERHCIYLHTARVGRTQANVAGGQAACFSAFDMGRMLPADEALEFSVEYAGVTAFGPVAVVTDPSEARHGLQLLLDKYAPHLRPGRDYRPITDDEMKRTAVFRLQIEDWTAKKKQVADDFPGAFEYPYVADEDR